MKDRARLRQNPREANARIRRPSGPMSERGHVTHLLRSMTFPVESLRLQSYLSFTEGDSSADNRDKRQIIKITEAK